jgi:hypothetical protein
VKKCPLGKKDWKGCEEMGEKSGDKVCLECSVFGVEFDTTCPIWLEDDTVEWKE